MYIIYKYITSEIQLDGSWGRLKDPCHLRFTFTLNKYRPQFEVKLAHEHQIIDCSSNQCDWTGVSEGIGVGSEKWKNEYLDSAILQIALFIPSFRSVQTICGGVPKGSCRWFAEEDDATSKSKWADKMVYRGHISCLLAWCVNLLFSWQEHGWETQNWGKIAHEQRFIIQGNWCPARANLYVIVGFLFGLCQ